MRADEWIESGILVGMVIIVAVVLWIGSRIWVSDPAETCRWLGGRPVWTADGHLERCVMVRSVLR